MNDGAGQADAAGRANAGTDAVNELRALKARLFLIRTVVDKVPSMLAYWDVEQRCRFANAAYERWFGVKPEELVGKTLAELLGPIYALNLPHILGALAGEAQHFEREIPDPAGGPPRHSQADYVPDVINGKVLGFAVLVSDITELRQIERRLGEAQAEMHLAATTAREFAGRLERVLATMREGVVVQDALGRVTVSNAAASRILDVSSSELAGRNSEDPRWYAVREDGSALPPDERPTALARRTAQRVENAIVGIRKPNGTLAWTSVTSVPRVEPDGSVSETVTTFHEISEMRNTMARAAQQERLAMAGTLAAGVGHEINNPLTYMVGNLDFALDELRVIGGASPSSRVRELVEALTAAREGADRIRKIVRGLRALSREDVALHPVDVRSVTDVALSLAAHELRNRASVVISPTLALPLVTADESRLTQVLVNLLVNAAQAFEGDDPGRNRIEITTAPRGASHVALTVKDNGLGVPVSLRSRIFDPFFTTKPVGEGTGLGLSVSRNLMASMKGELLLEDVGSGGAAFVIVLPVAIEPADDDAVPERVPLGAPSHGRIAVIDDEPAVVNVVRKLLAKEHQVVTFCDSREALAAMEAGQDFDLVLCDLMMPYLSGEELFTRISASRPELAARFVFITGGQTNAHVQAFLTRVPNERLDKPFTLQNLVGLARRFAGQSIPPP